ncbi:Hypothetical protein ORPV_695 [Orpheovirus IHUMI-LCC2]|uniref:Uncharacterized protein n=1 Tax=Orpheovirus IHUMI-LCC2 TaxID=2023057 RepID=A0A2I2L564_9VIRU|nr:Hypothetical protein ORPV_695 [Orpheovirus IHUMI-LCC2]SNW62599.1 Hypothetical protein ORPV_695 [Orpheovirus IHUMI-LCC2]
MGNGGTFNRVDYEADIPFTIQNLYGTQQVDSLWYKLPDNTWSNNQIVYSYTLKGTSTSRTVYANAWRNVENTPFRLEGGITPGQYEFKISPRIVFPASNVTINTIYYRGVYGGGAYRPGWSIAVGYGNSMAWFSMPVTADGKSLTAMALAVEYTVY